jgi:hypothetical protein
MNQTMISFLMIGFFVICAGFILWAAARANRQAGENLDRLAATLGLQREIKAPGLGGFHPALKISGQVRGKRIEVFPFSTGSGKSRVQWSAISATPLAEGGLTFELRPQGLDTKLMEMFGSREIQVGDPAFDRAWFIQTNQPDFLRAALVPELREKIGALAREAGVRGAQLQLEHGVVRYAEHGSLSDSRRCDRLGRALDAVCDLADVAEVFAGQKG